ncbi:hypothetical protein GGH12_003497, partial [Coemansia sp. RSA 1822]
MFASDMEFGIHHGGQLSFAANGVHDIKSEAIISELKYAKDVYDKAKAVNSARMGLVHAEAASG